MTIESLTDNRETVADIVAQMRGRGEDGRMDRRLWLDYADRIESAWKRERAKVEADALEAGGIVERVRTAEKTSAVGNAAATREALVKAKKAICHHAKHVCQSLSWENSDIQSNCADILCAHRELCEAKTAINASLAAPPRNCDRFGGDYKMLHTAWFDWTGSPRGHLPDGTAKLTFARWLLEMAETMKGEGDGI